MKKIIIQLLILIVVMPNIVAQTKIDEKTRIDIQSNNDVKNLEFYDGSIFVENIHGVIKINKNKEPELNFEVIISGKENDNKESIGFREGQVITSNDKAFKLKPGYIISGEKSTTQSIKVDLVPLINGLIPLKPIVNSQIRVELPEDYIFIRANKPVIVSKNGRKTTIDIKNQNKYLTPLVIVYTTNGLGVSIEKKVNTGKIKKGAVTFTLKVTNTGIKQLNNILIEDNFDPNDFSAKGNEFSAYNGEANDSRIIWQKKVESLEPGKSVELKYSVNANYDVEFVSLDAAKATLEGVLIGVSNKVDL